MTRRPHGGRDGFALLATLWLMVAIGVVGLEWGLRARDQRRVAMNAIDAGAARAAAESGVAHARARLDDALRRAERLDAPGSGRDRLDPWARLGAVMPDTAWSGAGAGWTVRLSDAGATLDLNRAGEDELRRFLVALRVDASRADRIAQSVADWKDPDDLHRARGAEREWYERAGRPVLPANGPFAAVAELRHVRDVTDAVFERAAPLLSVHGTGRVNLATAPRPVLLALPGIGEEAVRAIEELRSDGRPLPALTALGERLSPAARAELSAALPRLLARTTVATEEVRVVSEGWLEGSPVRVRAEALIVRSAGATFPVRLEVRP